MLFATDQAIAQNIVWFIVQILPLLVTLPGLITGQVRSTFVLCLVSLLYFIHGVLLAFEPGGQVDLSNALMGTIEIIFALGLCGSTAMLVRKFREADPARWGKD